MANSKRKITNLYSVRRNGPKILRRTEWVCNIPGHKYRVTKLGKVYKYLGNSLWKRVSVYSDGKVDSYLKLKVDKESWLLHRLVATVYLPNPNNLPVVMHLNNNKRDCRVKNLKWGTQADNMLAAWLDGCFKLPKKIKFYEDVNYPHSQGYSPREIASILPLHISSVKRILRKVGLTKYYKRFKNS